MSKLEKQLKAILKISIFSTAAMYGINRFIESTALSRNLLSSVDGKFFKWSHGVVYYKKIGVGSPLLLIHDLDPSSSGYEWSQIEDSLALDHTVYIIDLPGCGRSSKINQETYINYLYVRLLKEFIDEVIQEKTDVIVTGYSGSFVAMTAFIHDNIIGDITMINPLSPDQLSAPVTLRSKMVKALIDCPIIGTFLYYIDFANQQVEYNFTEKIFYNPFHISPRTIHTYYESSHIMKGNGKYLLSSLYGNYMSVNLERAISSLPNKITLIFGKEMNRARSTSEKYEKFNSSITSVFLSKSKMLPQLEVPEKFLHYIGK